jgi:hypothetical protein
LFAFYFYPILTPMSRILKIVIIWLLAFALPMQGFASSAMLDCGAAHQHLMPGSTSHAEGSASLNQQQQIHHHEQVSSNQDHAASHASADTASGTSSTDDAHHHGATKCSACTSCCLSSAISAPVMPEPATPLPSGLETSFQPDQQFAAYFPEGLERPPHSFAI